MAGAGYEQVLENLRAPSPNSVVPVLEIHLKRAAQHSLSNQNLHGARLGL